MARPETRFPLVLLAMLEDATENKFKDIVSWLPNDVNFFKIHQPKLFAERIMPLYFPKQNRYKSFLRQLNLYGFHRTATKNGFEAVQGSYNHPLFVRGNLGLCLQMERTQGQPAFFRDSETSNYSDQWFPQVQHQGDEEEEEATIAPLCFPSSSLSLGLLVVSPEERAGCIPLPLTGTFSGKGNKISFSSPWRGASSFSCIPEDVVDDIIFVFGESTSTQQ